MSASARDAILNAIRTALPGEALAPRASHEAIVRTYAREGALSAHQCVELLLDRLLDYDTEILQVASEQEIRQAIAQALERHSETELLASADFPASWLPDAPFLTTLDRNLSTPEIERVPAVVTTCEVAVASTGTIFLVHEGAQARRVLTLLPDHHICILRRDQVVELIPEAMAVIAPHSRKPITTISGPSATSDIEMTRIRGVHGPRRLTVILYGPPAHHNEAPSRQRAQQ